MRTSNDILSDIYQLIKADTSMNNLGGGIFKVIRKTNSVADDIVINLISANTSRFENKGRLLITIYNQNILNDNTNWTNNLNVGRNEKLLYDFSEKLIEDRPIKSDIYYSQSRRIYTEYLTDYCYTILNLDFETLNY